ncbi:hypothetical protein FP435_02480 [Lactobacillus sp. PV037]|uniref:hypothetical protein n=1 Tax=Lactobacillus sp. PV037 TaxID=2594496 RepID=UPI00224092CB|nr:hypothetical protein [Lactobacillus sp. PV037]QNQ83379.1 hypothetical protein FP435_02480 [Lactobacillus sp. PV037]
MVDIEKIFIQMEEKINKFADDLFFKNKAMIDLLDIQEQKEMLHLKMKEVEKLQAMVRTIKDFCEPQVAAIINVSKESSEIKVDYTLVKNQTSQLIQNYNNLLGIITYIEELRAKKNKSLDKKWLEMKTRLQAMDIATIEQIKEKAEGSQE